MSGESPKKSALFVCLGNICRSPMAEIIFRGLVADMGLLDEWVIDSAGTSSYHIGDTPDDRSVETCALSLESTISPKAHAHFKSIPLHRARQLVVEDFQRFDYIFGMDGENLRNIKKLAEHAQRNNKSSSSCRSTIKRIGEYHHDPKFLNVEDPYYGDMNGFKVNYQQLLVSCKSFLAEVYKEK
ncbi:acid phosphatase 1 [Heterostelium album PN500]|uniref:Acid phosphatase 1 n=1 Tax=Heterostelium pallidum (strain ATCC 26659 / Pp 5 / PN500) TaxID=670386 RepID=D3B3P7_HETP5|nr:acid phosphatase 1 [Heterostelium album PN500]EFA83945.1 acid phosphatase 1 [Heterostelium album PN500]|eukprot:XP_020436062.1 acid phosphatase 1 [Heterostelium album PN500]